MIRKYRFDYICNVDETPYCRVVKPADTPSCLGGAGQGNKRRVTG